MKNKKLSTILIKTFAILTILFMTQIAIIVCINVNDVYDSEPALKYRELALILGGFNVVPAIVAVLLIFQFARVIRRTKTLDDSSLKLFKWLERVFYFQAVYTFLSIFIIGEIENVGPPVIFISTLFIIFLSITLALFFNLLRNSLEFTNKIND